VGARGVEVDDVGVAREPPERRYRTQVGVVRDRALDDTRTMEIYADGEPWELLNSGNIAYYAARIFLSNRAITTEIGKIPAGALSLTVSRSIGKLRSRNVIGRIGVDDQELRHFRRGFRQRDVRNGPAGVTDGYGKIVHFAVLSAPRMRAPMFRASTVSVISSAPLQASSFQ
jgi:hypothetical protein